MLISEVNPDNPDGDFQKLIVELFRDLKSVVFVFANINDSKLKEIDRSIEIIHSAVVAFAFETIRSIASIIDYIEDKKNFIKSNKEMISYYMGVIDENFKDYI